MANEDTQNTLRDMLSNSFESVQSVGDSEVAAPVVEESIEKPTEVSNESVRDEKGRFAAKQQDATPKEVAEEPVQKAEEPTTSVEIPPRPISWKKEYNDIWGKIASGDVSKLTPDEAKRLAAYSMQREREFATGVSQYKQAAEGAKHLQEALAPFTPILQKQNLNAADFIKNLGSTYAFLVEGSPEQKLQAFSQLARSVGIPLEAISQTQQGGLEPIVPQLMQQIQELKSQIGNVTNWREMQEHQAVHNEIAAVQNNAKEFPYFSEVRVTMGKLIESGMANDLKTAYDMAVRMDEEVWAKHSERTALSQTPGAHAQAAQGMFQQSAQDKAAAAAAAKSKAVSVKSVTPTGNVKPADPKDLRSTLMQGFDAYTGGRM